MEHSGPTSWLLKLPLLPHDPATIHVNAAVVVFLFILVVSVLANRLITGRLQHHIIPSAKPGIVSLVDFIIEALHGMFTGTLGESGEKYFPFLAAIFLFILFGNLIGLLPHSAAPTSSVNTTFALGAAAFFYYNIMGVKEHGVVGYLKHFLMGLGILGVPIALLEIISHAIRPVSLGTRLFVNMFVDHALASKFSEICAWLLPVPLLILGLVVSMIQAFVFATLTAVYVQMATEHEHAAEHEEHAH